MWQTQVMNKVIGETFLCVVLFLVTSSTGAQTEHKVGSQAARYFDVYKQRQNFEKFMSFYSEDAVVEDLVYGHAAVGKDQIAAFFDWNKGEFSVAEKGDILQVETQLVSDFEVVTKGKFKCFTYFGEELGPWRFVIYQRFNSHGKIEAQEDWINYTPKSKYLSGQNLNE